MQAWVYPRDQGGPHYESEISEALGGGGGMTNCAREAG